MRFTTALAEAEWMDRDSIDSEGVGEKGARQALTRRRPRCDAGRTEATREDVKLGLVNELGDLPMAVQDGMVPRSAADFVDGFAVGSSFQQQRH